MMIRGIVQKIVASKSRCSEASRLHGEEPIFRVASETEKLASKLPQFIVQTESDFREFVDMIYRFIIEPSGNGKRLPEDPIVDSMKMNIKELRNHFFHIREFGKPSEVKRKYRKVGEIYQNLIGKRVPEGEDWQRLQKSLLMQILHSLDRIFNLLSFEDVRKDSASTFQRFEDNRIFIFGKKATKFRRAMKGGYLSGLAAIPVFLPEFHSFVSPPRLGRTRSAVYVTSRPPWDGEISQFDSFIKGIEYRWRENRHLLSTYGPIYWTISKDNSFTYGCGASSLTVELQKHSRVAVGGIMQACFGEHYDRTCFLVLYAYRKGDRILDIGVDLYLSSVPTEFSWIEKLLNVREHFASLREDVKIEHFSIEPVHFLRWIPRTRRKIKSTIIGGLRREGFGLSSEDREHDIFKGLIFQTTSLKPSDYHIKDSWNMKLLKTDLECPIFVIDEFVAKMRALIRPHNAPRSSVQIETKPPEVSMFAFDAYGATIFGIATYPSWGMPGLTRWTA